MQNTTYWAIFQNGLRWDKNFKTMFGYLLWFKLVYIRFRWQNQQIFSQNIKQKIFYWLSKSRKRFFSQKIQNILNECSDKGNQFRSLISVVIWMLDLAEKLESFKFCRPWKLFLWKPFQGANEALWRKKVGKVNLLWFKAIQTSKLYETYLRTIEIVGNQNFRPLRCS